MEEVEIQGRGTQECQKTKKVPKSAVYKQVHTPLINEDPKEYSDMVLRNQLHVNCPQAAIPAGSGLKDRSV